MKAIKKINNNVAICVDGNHKELVAFGKGIGFPQMPYEIKDIAQISMTFYKIDSRFYQLIEEIPEEIFEVSALIVDQARTKLKSSLNPNLVVSLADHLQFAIMRLKKYKKLEMMFSYDVEQLYPVETSIGKYALELIQKKLFITLPESEITNIAMHFVNAKEEQEQEEDYDVQQLLEEVTQKIEAFFDLKLERKEFNYNRFAMHIRYYLKRIADSTQYKDDNLEIVKVFEVQNPKIYDCAIEISSYIDEKLNSKSTKDEQLYLMIHISRMIRKVEEDIEESNI